MIKEIIILPIICFLLISLMGFIFCLFPKLADFTDKYYYGIQDGIRKYLYPHVKPFNPKDESTYIERQNFPCDVNTSQSICLTSYLMMIGLFIVSLRNLTCDKNKCIVTFLGFLVFASTMFFIAKIIVNQKELMDRIGDWYLNTRVLHQKSHIYSEDFYRWKMANAIRGFQSNFKLTRVDSVLTFFWMLVCSIFSFLLLKRDNEQRLQTVS